MRFPVEILIKKAMPAALLPLLFAFGCSGQTQNANVEKAVEDSPPVFEQAKILTLPEAIDLALKQASNFKAAQINEQIAAEDVKQAKANFYPRIAAQPNLIYTSPSSAKPLAGEPRLPSFLGANAISEYQAVVNASGEIDVSGRLKATLERNKALLAAARSGSEIARRDLIQAVNEAYFNLALASVRRRGAATNLQAADEFEANIKLQLDAGEVAPVDLIRARLQTSGRRDELEQARANEAVTANILRGFVGYNFSVPVATEDLLTQLPNAGEIEVYTQTAIENRPEFAQFEAERRAAELDFKIARSERRPQIVYSVSGGFISDSLRPNRVGNSTGIQANVGISLPLFDFGAIRSRQTQAQLRIKQAENTRQSAERQFAQDFYTARAQAVSAAARIRQLGESIKDAELNLSASLARYQAGEAAIIEVTDAQNTLIAQKQSLYQAIFDYQTARTRLQRAIGK